MKNLESFKIACVYVGVAVMFVFGTAIARPLGIADEIAPNAGSDVAHFVQINTVSDWNAMLAQERAMVYVDCDWNAMVVAARKHFFELAATSKNIPVYRLIWKGETVFDESPLSEAVNSFWRTNGIDPGSMKNLNGAGTFVWLKAGRSIDSVRLDLSQSSEKLKAKTAELFK